MKVTISNNDSGDLFSVAIEDATREDVLAVRSATDQRQQVTPALPNDIGFDDPHSWNQDRQHAFIEAARLYHRYTGNKIMAIKFLRTLSDPMLSLRDAKGLADYAIDGPGSSPLTTWIKSI